MRNVFLPACTAALLVSMGVVADEVRYVQPSFHPAQAESTTDGSGKRMAPAKSVPALTPSPILVHLTATVGEDGQVRLDCGSGPARDFRTSALASRQPAAEAAQ